MSRKFYASPGTIEMIRYGADIFNAQGDLLELSELDRVPVYISTALPTGRIGEQTASGGYRMLTVKINRPLPQRRKQPLTPEARDE
jgi:hypothetical protein